MYDTFDDKNHPNLNDIEGDGGMRQFDDYKAIGVDTIIKDISKLADDLINTTCNFYLSNSELFDDDDHRYITAIKGSERNNLQILLKQVKYVEHILDNLMRQLDNGGYMDNSIYTTIQEMQKSSMEITMQVSKYTRNLPDYFKYVKMDIEQSKEQVRLESEGSDGYRSVGSRPTDGRALSETNDGNNDGGEGDEKFNRPYRGVRQLLMDLENEESSLDLAIERTKGNVPEPIIIDGDGNEIESEIEDVEEIEYEDDNDQ